MANKFISSLTEWKDKLFELLLFLLVMGLFVASFGIVIFQKIYQNGSISGLLV